MNEIRKSQAANILSCYEDEGSLFLKSEEINEICKGRKAEPLGTKKKYGDKDYIKTANGWKPIGKNSGAAKQAHDFVHGDKEDERDVIQEKEQKKLGLSEDQYAIYQYSLKNLNSVSNSKRNNMLKQLKINLSDLEKTNKDLYEAGKRILEYFSVNDKVNKIKEY